MARYRFTCAFEVEGSENDIKTVALGTVRRPADSQLTPDAAEHVLGDVDQAMLLIVESALRRADLAARLGLLLEPLSVRLEQTGPLFRPDAPAQ